MAIPEAVKKLFLLPILFIVLIVLSSLLQPMKDLTDAPRASMNCINTPTFNQTAWDLQTPYQHTIYSTGCYVLNWDVLLFIGLLSILAIWGWLS